MSANGDIVEASCSFVFVHVRLLDLDPEKCICNGFKDYPIDMQKIKIAGDINFSYNRLDLESLK